MEENVSSENITENKPRDSKKLRRKIIYAIGVFLLILILLSFLLPIKILLSPDRLLFVKLITEDISSAESTIADISKDELIKFFTNNSEKTSEYNIDFLLGSKKMNMELIQNKDFLAIKADNIYNKYVLTDSDKLDLLWKGLKMEGDNLPKAYITEEEFLSALALTDKEKKVLEKFAQKSLYDILGYPNKDRFVLSKSDNLNAIELRLSQYDLIKIEEKLLKRLKNNEVLDIIVLKSQKLEELYKKTGVITEEATGKIAIDKAELLAQIEGRLNEVKKSLINTNDSFDKNNCNIFRIIYTDDLKIVERDIIQRYTEDEKILNDLVFKFTTKADNSKSYYELKYLMNATGTMYYQTISDEITKIEKGINHKIMFIKSGTHAKIKEGVAEEEMTIDSFEYEDFEEKNEYNLKIINKSEKEKQYIFSYDQLKDFTMVLDLTEKELKLEVKIPNILVGMMSLNLDITKLDNFTKDSIKGEVLDLTKEDEAKISQEFDNINKTLETKGIFNQ